MKKQLLILMMLLNGMLGAWSGGEETGDKPIFFGKLTSQEGRTFNVTNIVIARDQSGGRTIKLYEMPRTPGSTAGKDAVMIPGNPYQDLTTTELDLLKVKKIEVPNAQASWIWEKPQQDKRASSLRYEFIELRVTWKGDQTNSYLLELGTENSTKPVKVFCDSMGTTPVSTDEEKAKPMFCDGIAQTELRKKGAPFPSVKELVIDGYCYKPPKGTSKTPGPITKPQVSKVVPAERVQEEAVEVGIVN